MRKNTSEVSVPELSVFPTESLIRELMSRFGNAVFAGSRENIKIEDSSVRLDRMKGTYTGCLGLAIFLKEGILRDIFSEYDSEATDDE